MGTSIEEYRMEERVRKAYFRHRGNLLAVLDETKLPKEYIEKAVLKIKKGEDWKVSRLVAEEISREMLLGRQQRIGHLVQEIEMYRENEKVKKSTCCKDLVRRLDTDGVIQYECLGCGNFTDIVEVVNPDAHKMLLVALDELRKEDELFYKFSEKVGIFETPPQTVIKNQQNFVVMPKGELDEATVKEISALSRVEQDALRLSIEKTISEAEVVEDGEGK